MLVFGIFLFVFNILLVNIVSAYRFSYESCSMHENVVTYIKNLDKFKNYKYYLSHANNGTPYGNLIEVFLFNDDSVTFSCSNSGGWDSISSSKSFESYHYILIVDLLDDNVTPYIKSIFSEGLENRQINNIVTGSYASSGKYPIFSNVNIYGNSLSDIWYEKVDSTLYPYIHQDVGDIEVFRSGGIDIYPRRFRK